MALQRFKIEGFGQLELNQVAFRRDGRIEAQCALGDEFADIPCENGMILGVDNVNGVVTTAVDGLPVALHYSAEHLYEEDAQGLKDFALEPGSFLPRLGYLAVGDKFTTNCLCYDTTDFANDEALKEAYAGSTAIYGGVSDNGAIKVSKAAPSTGLVLRAIKGTGAGSMPDGQFGMKFQVVKV